MKKVMLLVLGAFVLTMFSGCNGNWGDGNWGDGDVPYINIFNLSTDNLTKDNLLTINVAIEDAGIVTLKLQRADIPAEPPTTIFTAHVGNRDFSRAITAQFDGSVSLNIISPLQNSNTVVPNVKYIMYLESCTWACSSLAAPILFYVPVP